MRQGAVCETISITLRNRTEQGPYHQGDTVLEAARRLGLRPATSCLAGQCATCVARLSVGTAAMWNNEALPLSEVADGYILTCQAVPTSREVVLAYEE